ncbi:SDR family oxidoreductase [Streptomyces cavernae]|uniref:SDR family oxidoreductase n=1 Tax=Streptomyces cavernae TaxID=2259034 RepID=UPI000FEBE857|nr:SDR family oxidoreductase [Streptomyces cavernae]
MILVTGVTGTVGAAVVRALGPHQQVRALARRPELAPSGIEVYQGEYADHDALLRALTGVRAAFLVTNSPVEPDDERFTAAAREAGVQHLVKLSAQAVADETADDLITRRQRHNETVIRSSGLDWTLLRPRAFMSNTLSWAPSIRAHGVVRALYGMAPNSCVDPRDIAEVAARVLTEPGHEGRTYALTGPEPITPEEQTRQLGDVLGRPLRFAELTPEQALAHLTTRYPQPVARALVESAGRTAAGAKAEVSPAVAELTGRPARTFRTWAAEHAAAFG